MKKFFAIVAAALVAFSFASCEKGQSGSSFFKISVSNVTTTTADVVITPANADVYYGAMLLYGEGFVPAKVDSLANLQVEEIADLVKQYGVNTLVEYGYIMKGEFSGTIDQLEPNTEFVVVAFKLDVAGDVVTLGSDVTYKTFKTQELVIDKDVNLGVLEGAGFEDYRESDGSYLAWAAVEGEYDVTLNIYDDDFVGDFTMEDIDAEYSYIWVKGCGSDYGMTIVEAELKSVLAGEDAATISGWVVAENGAKYTFSFTHPTVEAAGAPKKAVKKAGLQPAKLKVRK